MITDMQGLDGVLHTDREEIVTKFLEYFKSRWVGDLTTEGACDLVRSTIRKRFLLRRMQSYDDLLLLMRLKQSFDR